MCPSYEQLVISPAPAMPEWHSSMNVEIFSLGDSEEPVQLPPDPGPVEIPPTPNDPPQPGAPGEPVPDAPDPPSTDPVAPPNEPPSPDTGGGDSDSDSSN
jgi:hypothetical protein